MEPIETPSAAWIREFEALRALARALIADDHAAEDAVQETWLRAQRFEADGAGAALRRPGAWLSTTLRNLSRDRRRAVARRGEVRAASELADSLPSPAQVAERLELTQRVVAALTALPEPYRTALHLHYFEGLTVAEIAERAGLPLETLRTCVRRGLARMRKELDGTHSGERSAWCTALAVVTRPPGLELAPSSALPMTVSATTFPLIGALFMSKAWIGAVGALVLIGLVLRVDFDGDAPRVVRPALVVLPETTLVDATTEVQAADGVAERAPIEALAVAEPSIEPVTNALIPVHGRVVIVDAQGIEHTSQSGRLHLYVHRSEATPPLREVAVEGGTFELAVPTGALVQPFTFKGEIDTNGRTALLDRGPSGAFSGPDPIEVLGPIELVVRGRWTDEVLLHVASSDTVALTGVEVRRRTHWRAIGPALHPGDAPEVNTVVTGGASPIALPDPGRGLRLVPYWVRAPGLAWRRIEIDHDARGEHTVQLAPGGALELRVTGTVSEGELFLRPFAPGGDQGWSFQALADVTVGRDGRARLDDLQPGSYAARLDRGSYDGALTLARGAVVVKAGETTWLDLAVDPAVLDPRRVHLTGTLTLPLGFTPGRHELRLDVEPRAQGQDQVRLPLARMPRLGDQPGVLAWDAGEVLPAQYLATISELLHRELVDARGDEPVVHLVLPPLARVSVAIVDAATGAPIERARLGWAVVRKPARHAYRFARGPTDLAPRYIRAAVRSMAGGVGANRADRGRGPRAGLARSARAGAEAVNERSASIPQLVPIEA